MDRSRSTLGGITLALILAMVGAVVLPAAASAEAPANEAFERTWERTDRPISDLIVNRTWIWGPEAFTTGILEPYAEAPNGQRVVQYYDKSRMELTTDPNVSPDDTWYVVNGLLATELITGRLQLGHNKFEQHQPAQINIAGDPTDANAPTYASFNALLNQPAHELDAVIDATVHRDGTVGEDPAMLDYGVTAAVPVEETGHTVASVFWDFMTSEGTIHEDDVDTWGQLFRDAFFATGLPISEAYWTTVLVNGEPHDVLVQAFERRVLTYTPSNPAGWQVEAGNVGRHYHDWRYAMIPGESGSPGPGVPSTPTEPSPPIPMEPIPSDPDTPVSNDTPPANLGTVGTAGRTPLGKNAYSPLAEPYLDLPVSDAVGYAWFGVGPNAKENQQKSFLPYSATSPSGKVFFVFDFNDGSIYVSPIVDAHFGIQLFHTWRADGTFYVKAWTVDPITGVRSVVNTMDVVVK